jgi:hypothetical protein
LSIDKFVLVCYTIQLTIFQRFARILAPKEFFEYFLLEGAMRILVYIRIRITLSKNQNKKAPGGESRELIGQKAITRRGGSFMEKRLHRALIILVNILGDTLPRATGTLNNANGTKVTASTG